jgi:putative sterol carrier protein
MMTHYANALSLETAGALLRPESFLLPFALAKPMTIKTIEAGFVRAGYELASAGKISAETKEKAETPLSSDLPYFKKYANIYWEHAVALGEKSADIDLLCKKVTADVRILMQEMARSYDSVSTAKLKANFQFEFTDKNLFFTLVIDHGKCLFFTEKSGNADLLINTTTEVWGKVFTRQINVRDALVTKEISLTGDKFLFSRLDRYFPPPVA